MNDPLRMRCFQTVGQLCTQPQDFFFRQGPAREFVVESHASDQFHHQEVNSVFAAKLVDRPNIGVVQLGQSQCLAAKALACGVVGEGAPGQDFQRNIALQLLVMGAIHHAHTAGTDLGDNAIVRYGPIEHAGIYAGRDLLKAKFLSLICIAGTATVSRGFPWMKAESPDRVADLPRSWGWKRLGWETGIEPATSGATVRCSTN